MKTLVNSFMQLFKQGNRSATRIVLLGTGLAMGLVLIARIYFEQTYEGYVPELERVFCVTSLYQRGDEEQQSWTKTPGAIAPGIKRYSPAVETATRYTPFSEAANIKRLDGSEGSSRQVYRAERMIFADSCLFDIFARRVYTGSAKQVLGTPAMAMVSRSFAEKLGGVGVNPAQVVGVTFAPEFNLSTTLTVGGVFEDFPKNSYLHDVDVILSLPTIGRYSYDGSENWVGNDRYYSYVKLSRGVLAADMDEVVNRMCEENLPQEELKKAGVKIGFALVPLSSVHSGSSEVRSVITILLILSIVVLTTAVLNYVLIALSGMVRKAKTIAVHKCYGASSGNIYSMVFSETFAYLFLSLILSAIIVLTMQSTVRDFVGTNLAALLSPASMLILLVVLGLIFLLCGLLPGMAYSRIPVATAFRRYRESSRRWKHVLLFAQFMASAFFITLLLVATLQYRFMLNSDPGYAYKNLVYMSLSGIPMERRALVKQEVGRLPFVEAQAFSTQLPIAGASGNNIYLPNDKRELFNVADMYFVDDGYFAMMEIPIVDGRTFNEENPTQQEVMVSRSFVEKMKTMTDWSDGAVGKSILVTEHSQGANDVYTICGVYEDYMVGFIGAEDTRPSVQFYSKTSPGLRVLLIKLRELTPDNVNALSSLVAKLVPDRDVPVKIYSMELASRYSDIRRFRDMFLIAGIIVLIITVVGLVGYSVDEINRRRSEIAIRKINGATTAELLQLLLTNVVRLSVVAVTGSVVISYLVTDRLMQLFSQKIELSWWLFALCSLLTVLVVVGVVLASTYRAANENPIKSLKSGE